MDDELQRAIAEKIELSPYSDQWPARFRQEAERLLTAFPGRFIAIEHIGSTAVPGLSAKPVIDLMAGMASISAADAVLEELCRSGYVTSAEFNATLGDSRWLMRQSGGHRTHHLHLMVHAGATWKARLAFREVLRRDPRIAGEYLRLKQDLATRHADDREAYTQAKTAFIIGLGDGLGSTGTGQTPRWTPPAPGDLPAIPNLEIGALPGSGGMGAV